MQTVNKQELGNEENQFSWFLKCGKMLEEENVNKIGFNAFPIARTNCLQLEGS